MIKHLICSFLGLQVSVDEKNLSRILSFLSIKCQRKNKKMDDGHRQSKLTTEIDQTNWIDFYIYLKWLGLSAQKQSSTEYFLPFFDLCDTKLKDIEVRTPKKGHLSAYLGIFEFVFNNFNMIYVIL